MEGDAVNWTPHFDYHDESRWPPHEHPLYSLFHGARLHFNNDEFNYKNALKYAEMVRDAGKEKV
jgi:hypothetical protein